MLNLSYRVSELISKGSVEYFYLIEATRNNSAFPLFPVEDGFSSHITSYPQNLSFFIDDYGSFTFKYCASLHSVEAPKSTSIVDRSAFKLTFADVNQALKSRFDQKPYGVRIRVWVGLIDLYNGSPLSDFSDYINTQAGFIDSLYYEADFGNSTAIATIECSNPMGDLDRSNPYWCTGVNQRRRYPDDACFDDVFKSAKSKTVTWYRGE